MCTMCTCIVLSLDLFSASCFGKDRTFSILINQSFYRYPYVTGTSVIGIKYKDGILMTADMGGQFPNSIDFLWETSIFVKLPIKKKHFVGKILSENLLDMGMDLLYSISRYYQQGTHLCHLSSWYYQHLCIWWAFMDLIYHFEEESLSYGRYGSYRPRYLFDPLTYGDTCCYWRVFGWIFWHYHFINDSHSIKHISYSDKVSYGEMKTPIGIPSPYQMKTLFGRNN